MEELLDASVNGLRRADGNAGLGTVADAGAEGVDEAEVLPRRLDMVDRHPDAPVELDEADREGNGEEAGSAVRIPEFCDVGIPNPSAVEKNDLAAGGGSWAGGVRTGSGKTEVMSAGGGIGERE